MAKKRSYTSGSTGMVRYSNPRPQITVVKVPGSTRKARSSSMVARPKKHKRSLRKGGGGRASLGKTLGGVAIGAGAVGLLEKTGILDSMPNLPVIGKKGAIAIAAALMSHYGVGGEITRDVAIAATALSAYQLAKEGQISGDW